MKRTVTIEATDKHAGITFDQLSDLYQEVALSRAPDVEPVITVRTGYRSQLRQVTVTYEVFPAGG